MTGNRSLDEFLAGDDEAAETGETAMPSEAGSEPMAVDADPAEAASDDRARPVPDGETSDEDLPAVEPMAETFAWSARGGTCASCGERVERRWRDGGALVCEDCKAW